MTEDSPMNEDTRTAAEIEVERWSAAVRFWGEQNEDAGAEQPA